MKTLPILRRFSIILCVCFLPVLTACNGGTVTLSKNMLVTNMAEVSVTSITLDVTDGSLDSPLELLDKPLNPGETRSIAIGVPEKQAKKSEWIVQCFMEDSEQSNPFEFGAFNPHGDGGEISCFGVYWNDDQERYLVSVYLNGNEADDGIFASGEDSEDINGGGDLSIIKGEYYYLVGGDGGNILFHDEEGWGNTLQFNHFEEYGGLGSAYGGLEYKISGDRLTVTDDGELLATFTIEDMYTLRDKDGNLYVVEGVETYGEGDSGYNGTSAEDMLWSGIFVSDDGESVLALINFDGESFRFAFVADDNEDEGAAILLSPAAAEAEGYTFWFMDEDDENLLTVAGGAFQGDYIRLPDDYDME